MRKANKMRTTAFMALPVLFALSLPACLDEGEFPDEEDNDAGVDTGMDTHEVDCGEHGSAHGDHCHCFQGYMFDGETCVAPDEITEECQDGVESDSACVCPDTGMCPCEGDIEEHGGKKYCVPNPDA